MCGSRLPSKRGQYIRPVRRACDAAAQRAYAPSRTTPVGRRMRASHVSNRRSFLARREFLKFVAASPYVAAAGGIGAFLRLPAASAQNAGAQLTTSAELIPDAAAALNVFDFE